MNVVCSLMDVFQVVIIIDAPAIQVVIGMVANCMTGLQYSLVGIRIPGYIVANAEKSGFGVVLIQQIQYIWSNGRVGPIIECNVNGILIQWRHIPDHIFREELFEPFRRFYPIGNHAAKQRKKGIKVVLLLCCKAKMGLF
jgi:hypothetical protein